MNKRDFLKGLAAVVSLAALPVALKSEVLASTSISPPKIRHMHFRYDSVAMTYVKDVLGRKPDNDDIRNRKIKNEGWMEKSVRFYPRPVPPDPEAAAILLEQDRLARKYFADIA